METVDATYHLIEDGKTYCGAKLRQPHDGREYCHRPAGHGTDHVGIGRCRLHGGVTSKSKAGRFSKYNIEPLAERIADFEERHDYLDLKEELAILRVLAEDALKNGNLKEGAELLLSIAKVADTMNKIETSRENVLPISVLDRILAELNDIANAPDILGPYPEARRKFAERLGRFKVTPRLTSTH